MAEVRKRKEIENYKIDETQFHKNEKNKQSKNSKKKENHKDTLVKSSSEEKKSLWVRFRIFCHGVKSETKKVRYYDYYR